jgi:hypothetical protein
MFRTLVYLIVALAAAPVFAVNCGSGVCNSRVVAHDSYVAPSYVAPTYAATNYVPQYVTQNIFYEVGANVRYSPVTSQAVVQAEYGQAIRAMQRLQDQIADLKQYAMPAPPAQPPIQVYVVPTPAAPAQPAAQPQQPQQPAPQQPAASPPAFSEQAKPHGALETHCVKCHSGANAKGGFDITAAITCEEKVTALQKVLTGEMPKGKAITDEEAKAVLDELFNLKTTAPKEKFTILRSAPSQAVPQPTAAQMAEYIDKIKAK